MVGSSPGLAQHRAPARSICEGSARLHHRRVEGVEQRAASSANRAKARPLGGAREGRDRGALASTSVVRSSVLPSGQKCRASTVCGISVT
jgi:hypothetical protein